jgi:hypothetical protein
VEITLKVLFPRQIFDLATNFQRKFDNDHCNDVEKQSNFKKFDCLKADLSAFVETLSVSTFYNYYNTNRLVNKSLHFLVERKDDNYGKQRKNCSRR